MIGLFGDHHHKHKNPWEHAPAWAIELRFYLQHNQGAIMAAIDDLKTAVADLQATVSDVKNELIRLDTATAGGTPDHQIAPIVSSIMSATTDLATAIAASKAAHP